jgi:hypothetical protein
MYRAVIGCLVVLLSQGCATAYFNATELSTIPVPDAAETTHAAVTRTLVSEGFDIKVSDKNAGLVTTEFLKVGDVPGNPPFDWLLQLRCVVDPSFTIVQVKPTVRQSNRINASAYTEYVMLDLDHIEGSANEAGAAALRVLDVVASRYAEVIAALAVAVGSESSAVEHTEGAGVELKVGLYKK